MSEFEENKAERLDEFRMKLNMLYDEYHADVYKNDKLFKLYMELGNEILKERARVKGIKRVDSK